jgi:3-phosphoshikimate 1-carboxyvinyltransferase
MIVRPLRDLGVDVEVREKNADERVPIHVVGKGFLPTGDVTLPGDQSSQVVSSFLFWMPLASKRGILGSRDSTIRVQGRLVSRPYVDITLDVLRWAGIRIEEQESGSLYRVPSGQQFQASSLRYRVGGDYSSAAFLLAAASVCRSNVLVRGLVPDKQGDRAIVSILRAMGADLEESEAGIRVRGPARLRGIDYDCSHVPDLVPILCAVATFAEGRTTLRNIAHLRQKETDRLAGPTEELKRLGARIENSSDSISIEGCALRKARVDARGDHRMAMALIVAGLGAQGVEVEGAACIGKSYPSFVRDMRALGARISEGVHG